MWLEVGVGDRNAPFSFATFLLFYEADAVKEWPPFAATRMGRQGLEVRAVQARAITTSK